MNWIPIQTGWTSGRIEQGVDPHTIMQYQECQPRVNGIDPTVVNEYVVDMREYDESLQDAGIPGWKKFPHLYCVKTDDNQHILVSGFHRLDAILKVGYEKIDVYCIDGTLQDAIVLSKGENANNGVRRTNADKEYIVRSCLLDEKLRKWSNEQIAEWCGVAPNTIKNHEERLRKLQREEGEDYNRPTLRLFMKKDGTVGEKNTAEIGKRNGKEVAVDKVSGESKETVLEHLYQNRQDFQTTVSDFAQSGAYLNFAYCRRRIKSLVGLEDATDEGSTDYTQWDLQKIKAQSQIAAEGVQVIRGYLEEDPKIEETPIATLLSEMQRISEIHQSAKLDTYTRPFQHQPLSDAALKVEKLWTADWEAKSDEARLDDLNALEDELPSLIAAEDTARKSENGASVCEGFQTEGNGLSADERTDDTLASSQKQREHVNRLESLPGEIRQLLPTWQQAHGIEVTLTLKLLLNARTHIEFGRERGPDPFFREEMEDLLQRMKSNDEGFVKKVRELLRGSEPAQEQSNSVAQYEQTLTLIEKLKDGLKKVHVVDVEEFVEDILHFYYGIGVDELSTRPEETLKNISDFIEGFVDQPFAEWPEYIRDSHHIPKRELVLVSIGINNNTDDEFEVVEFTDESSDEIRCDLNALPEDLRTALLKLASEMIYAEQTEESS